MIRFFDILFSFIALLVFLPLLLPIAIVLKFTGEGEIFFLQERIGREGKVSTGCPKPTESKGTGIYRI